MAGVTVNDISLHEVNEAFSVVVRANEKVSCGSLQFCAVTDVTKRKA